MARAIGVTAALTATTEVPVNKTTYTEQTAGAQRSLVSSSANDTAAGTGVQKVQVVYYTLDATGKIHGPFSEIVTLNGTTAVAMVATNVALVERLYAMATGSGGVAAGIISLQAAADGSGATIASIAAGDTRTLLCHHYVGSSYQTLVDDVDFIGGDPAAASFELKVQRYPVASNAEVTVTGIMAAGQAGLVAAFKDLGPIAGPARIRAYVAPANANSQVANASFGFRDVKVILDQ